VSEDTRWALVFESRAEEDLARLDPPIARRVLGALARVVERGLQRGLSIEL
jgi:hypothetical protein